jgi:hypothetical protein
MKLHVCTESTASTHQLFHSKNQIRLGMYDKNKQDRVSQISFSLQYCIKACLETDRISIGHSFQASIQL